VQGDLVSLASHKAQRSTEETQALLRIERAFRDAGFQPPAPLEVLALAKVNPSHARGLLETLIKEWARISRKYAIPLLEYLDHQHVTSRQGDLRIVL
jgi:hypothetical protein